MKTTLTTSQAAQILVDDENANWTRAGAYALAEYLEELEEDTGEEIQFDSVGLRCDWNEHASLEDFRNEYFADAQECREALNADEDADEDELNELTCQFIEDCGTLIEFDGGIIVSSF
jgi:hypothetical protein